MARHRSADPPTHLRRIRALLSGGLVLGLGATATLASWTDQEYAHADFSTTRFDTESGINGIDYADQSEAPGAVMSFDATGMSPDTHRYGMVLIRTKPGSVAGTLSLSGAAVANGAGDTAPLLGSALVYRAVVTTGPCNLSAFTSSAEWVVGAGGYVGLATAGSSAPSLAGAPSAAPGDPTGICFDVYLPAGADNGLQGKSASAVWRITATSID